VHPVVAKENFPKPKDLAVHPMVAKENFTRNLTKKPHVEAIANKLIIQFNS
jgi:hypothetical protein